MYIPNPPFYGLKFQSGKIQKKHCQSETAAREGVVPAAACSAVRRKFLRWADSYFLLEERVQLLVTSCIL